MAIEVDMNLTGKDRSATITVTSGTDEISVTVTQKGVKEDNTPLTAKDLLVALPWKHVSTTMTALDGPDEGETEVLDGAYTLTFKNDGTITVVGQDQDEFTDFFGLDPLPTYSLSGSGDKLTWIVASDEPQDSPNSVEFDVVKLTASELEFTVIDVVHVAEDSGDGNGLNEYDYNQSFTVKLTRGDGGGTEPPVSGDSQLLTSHPWNHVSTLYEYTQPADEEDVVEDAPYTVTFETNGTITIVDADGEPFGSYLLNGEGNTWSVADDILTMHFIEEDENVPFTIVKLTDTELELKVVGIEEEWEDSEGNSGVDIFDMTMKFVKP